MLAGLLFRALREPFRQAFVHLPPLPATSALPDEITGLRFSLMRAMQGMRSATLHQFGGNGLFEYYLIGYSVLQPAIAIALIKHDWVTAGPHWIESVAQYHLSATGLAVKQQLEDWWAALTVAQRLRAVLLE